MPTIEQARAWYEGADPIHDFDHVMRVYRMAEKLANIEGGDIEIIHAAALLHDAEGSAPGQAARASHHHRSAEFAEEVLSAEGWKREKIEAVKHCIRAHRFRSDGDKPETIEAQILFDADKMDVLGAIGVARVVAYAALSGNPFYAPPSEKFLSTGELEVAEAHSAYHEYMFKLRHIQERMFTKTSKAFAQERAKYIEAYFQQLMAEFRGER